MTKIGGAGESRLLERIRPYLAAQAGRDDAAIVEPRGAFEVVSSDMAVEGIHFDLGWMTAEDAGWRALTLAVGDLAAKGATPAWALTSVAAPRGWNMDDFVGLFVGMHALGSRIGMSIEGGDMSVTDGPAVLSITVSGHTSRRPLPRSAARPGWSVAVTGPLGAPAVALRERKVLRLEPLIAEGRRLNEAGLCCGDISDGLVREMEKFAAMSGFGCTLRAQDVARAAGASIEQALTSGEEVELVCVGPDDAIRAAKLKAIGEMRPDRRIAVEGVRAVTLRGYDHFA